MIVLYRISIWNATYMAMTSKQNERILPASRQKYSAANPSEKEIQFSQLREQYGSSIQYV